MTPAITAAEKHRIAHTLHEYPHDPDGPSYGAEAAAKLGVPEHRVFKTLVVQLDEGSLAVAVIPVANKLNMKILARALGAKKAVMAAADKVQRATGYVLGGISPLGQKRALPTLVDASASELATVYVSAGRRGLEIELRPTDLLALTDASYVELCR
jgi:Cys-tRNA(Pro)/Cys-tRNA(Cys) deacylase